jgi:hypothetical protein
MELEENASGRDRLVRMLAAAGLTVVATDLLRKGRRVTGALAAVGAVALGYQVATATSGAESVPGATKQPASGQIHCAICGEPIVPGQPRGPDENDNTVHIECREATSD